ncbi:MAG: hypothetical protein ACYDD1_07450 [Caulobacteraceae bacterium]
MKRFVGLECAHIHIYRRFDEEICGDAGIALTGDAGGPKPQFVETWL